MDRAGSRWCRMLEKAAVFFCAVAVLTMGCEKSRGGRATTDKQPAAEKSTNHKVIVLTDANFAEKTSKGVVLVDFWATWCPPCRTQGPIVEKIAKRYAGRVTVGKLDVDKNPKTAKRFDIRAIPTLIIFKDGKVHRQLVGLQQEQKLASELDAALGRK